MGRPRKAPREKDLTSRYKSGELEEEHALEQNQRFGDKTKHHQANKTAKTVAARAELLSEAELAKLPIAQVVQVHSLYFEVSDGKTVWLATARKTVNQVLGGDIIVGDRVHIRDTGSIGEQGLPQAAIESVLPRVTVLTRADSFKQQTAHPVVANADQMLIVAAARDPAVKWSLIDRVLIAAQLGGLKPIICLNKADLPTETIEGEPEPREALAYYASIGFQTLETSTTRPLGLQELVQLLRDKSSVLTGHSGVGKSSLVRAVQPHLDLRVGIVSDYTGKGRHTTTSARIYPLDFGGSVIDTPGVRMFGLLNLTEDILDEHFADVLAGTAPEWRVDSRERIAETIPPAAY